MSRVLTKFIIGSVVALLAIQLLGMGWPLLVSPPPGVQGPPPPPVAWLALQLVLSAAAFTGIAWWLARPVVRDLAILEEVSQQIAAGRLHARAELSGPTATLGANFNAMASRVEDMLLDQRMLLQAVSHELRTPQTRMRFQLEALRGALGESPLIDALDDELDVVDALLQDLLDMQRLEQQPSGNAEPEATRAVLEEVVRSMRPLAQHLPIELVIEGELMMGRRDLKLIAENLVSNAQRHAKSQVLITAKDGVLTVSDDGDGVPESQRERIFEPFASMDVSRSHELGGIGLGLALVARAARRWGAHVSVETAPLGGACFVVRWP